MRYLPLRARLFVAAVIGLAGAALAYRLPAVFPDDWMLFVVLAAGSTVASGLRLRLPLGTSASNLSVSYTIDFASLLLLGADPTMVVAGLSALTQSVFRTARKNPPYRVLFNISALILTVQITGWIFYAFGGQIGVFAVDQVAKPLVAAALVYYLANTAFVAIAVGLSERQPVWRLWQGNFLWTAPSYLVGAGAAAATAALYVNGWGWLLPLTIAPVYLTFRSYRIYIDRIAMEQRHSEELAYAALHDHLTKLPNRALFSELLTRALAKTRRSPRYRCAVLFIDLDHFKMVNDSLGHIVGDKFLTAIARRLELHLRPTDVLARLGGDEFAVLVDDLCETNDVNRIVERLQQGLVEPFDIDGRPIYASASIGIAFCDERYYAAEDLLRDADTAMYQAKAKGRGRYQLFIPEMHTGAMERLTLQTDLRRAMERREFVLHYQPILELESENICGFEALVRWMRPDGVMVGPSEFISMAEETGLIVPLTNWVLNEACRQAAAWQRMYGRPLTITVNVSTKLFERAALVDEVRQAIEDSGLIAGTLRLEITESFLVNDSTAVAKRLEELRMIPVKLYLDDFGTGYSSLSYLHQYRLDALKIDRSFVSRIGSDETSLVAIILSLARELGIGVIAEGVETAQQATALLALNCGHVQGYHFSKPLGADAANELLSRCVRDGRVLPATPTPGAFVAA